MRVQRRLRTGRDAPAIAGALLRAAGVRHRPMPPGLRLGEGRHGGAPSCLRAVVERPVYDPATPAVYDRLECGHLAPWTTDMLAGLAPDRRGCGACERLIRDAERSPEELAELLVAVALEGACRRWPDVPRF